MSSCLVDWLVPSGLCLCFLSAPAAASQGAAEGIWISRAEIERLPMIGRAWNSVLAAADKPLSNPNIGERDNNSDVYCLATAMVYVRTGEPRYRDQVIDTIQAAIGSERSGDVLSLGRNLPGYVIAADLVGLPLVLDKPFRAWLKMLPDLELKGTTLRLINERRPNNWGTHAGGARAVAARYLGNAHELERVAQIFRGYLGERAAYDDFIYGDLDWQADPSQPVGINPRGAQRDGHSIDGVLPDDQRRSGPFTWPPPKENYVYEALQGALLQAVVLSRAGYDTWEWGDRALLRAALWLHREADFPAEGDDTWQSHVFNHYYDARLPLVVPARHGKNVGWTDWTMTPHHIR